MQVEHYRSMLAQQLSRIFKVDQVRATIVPASELNGPMMKNMLVYSYEFIINGSERYFTFAIESEGTVYFTRPKEGIREYLSRLIRAKDFALLYTGDIHAHKDVIGKFIESRINFSSRELMERTFESAFAVSSALNERDSQFDYTFGFKVTRHHKEALTFDSVVELLIRRSGEVTFESYRGEFISGEMGLFKDKDGVEISVEEIARG